MKKPELGPLGLHYLQVQTRQRTAHGVDLLDSLGLKRIGLAVGQLDNSAKLRESQTVRVLKLGLQGLALEVALEGKAHLERQQVRAQHEKCEP